MLNLAAGVFGQINSDPRMIFEKSSQITRQYRCDRTRVGHNPNMARHTRGELTHLEFHLCKLALNGAGMMQDCVSSLGKAHAPGVPRQKRQSHAVLEITNARAGSPECQVKGLGRLGDGSR